MSQSQQTHQQQTQAMLQNATLAQYAANCGSLAAATTNQEEKKILQEQSREAIDALVQNIQQHQQNRQRS